MAETMTLAEEDVVAMDDGEVLRHGEETALQLVPVGRKFLVDPYCMLLAPAMPPPTREEVGEGIERIIGAHNASLYWLGDMVLLGESLFGEEIWQYIDHNEIPESTVRGAVWVSKQVPPSNRALAKTWSHCQAVAALQPDVQKEWLLKARENDWTVAKLKQEMAAAISTSKLTFWLVVKVTTESQSDKIAKQLESEGLIVVQHQGVKKEKSPKKIKAKLKAKKGKKAKGDVTAKKRRGRPKLSTSRRAPL